MKVILINGANKSGKFEICEKILDLLKSRLNSFKIILKEQNGEDNKDYIVNLSGKDKKSNKTTILLNYASDNEETISKFSDWIKNKGSFDIVITAIRTKGKLHDDVMTVLNKKPSDIMLTLQLKKIEYENYQTNDLDNAIKNYQDGILNTVSKCLQDSTFSLF